MRHIWWAQSQYLSSNWLQAILHALVTNLAIARKPKVIDGNCCKLVGLHTDTTTDHGRT